MTPNSHSMTAWRAALSRARHQVLDGGSVFRDPLALTIIGPEAASQVQIDSAKNEGRVARAFRRPLAARSRIAEDTLQEAVERGVQQYIVLGAGLDTFAYRNPYADNLRVFEVDHPATQRWKRELLAAAEIGVPPSMDFVPVDLAVEDFMTALIRAGFNPDKPTVCAWLGVTVYLDRDTVLSTLQRMRAEWARGSVVVFDYVSQPAKTDVIGRCLLGLLSRRYARMGEPWRSFFRDGELTELLSSAGFSHIEDLRPDEIAKQLFAGTARKAELPRSRRKFAGVIRAWT